MLPYKHFVIAAVMILITAFFYQVDITTGVFWMIIGGIVAILIDIDILIFLILNKIFKFDDNLEKFINPINLIKDYDEFEAGFKENKILFYTIMATHILISAGAIIGFFYFNKPYLVPVTAGVGSHLASEIYAMMKSSASESF